jgi:hypothetical protein
MAADNADNAVRPVKAQTIRGLANHAWNNLNFAQSVLHSVGPTAQFKDLVEEAKCLCDRIVHSEAAGNMAGTYVPPSARKLEMGYIPLSPVDDGGPGLGGWAEQAGNSAGGLAGQTAKESAVKASEVRSELAGQAAKPPTEVCSVCGEEVKDWIDLEWAKGHVCFSCDVNHDTDVKTLNAVAAAVGEFPRRTVELDPNKAAEIYGDSFRRLSVLDRKDGLHRCYCCEAPSTGRSSMNIWGQVCDFETCDACNAENDGKRADSLPTPKDKPCGR